MRERILNIAKERFSYYGMDKTTMINIAQSLKISTGILRHYFSDKYRLFHACVDQVLETEKCLMKANFTGKMPLKESLQKLVEIKLRYRWQFILIQHLLGPQDIRRSIPERTLEKVIRNDQRQIRIIIKKSTEKGQLPKVDSITLSRQLMDCLAKVFYEFDRDTLINVLKGYYPLTEILVPLQEGISHFLDSVTVKDAFNVTPHIRSSHGADNRGYGYSPPVPNSETLRGDGMSYR